MSTDFVSNNGWPFWRTPELRALVRDVTPADDIAYGWRASIAETRAECGAAECGAAECGAAECGAVELVEMMIASRILGIHTVLEVEHLLRRTDDPAPWLTAARAFHDRGFMSEDALACFADMVLDVVAGWRNPSDPEASRLWCRMLDLIAKGGRFDEMDETEPRAEIDVAADRWVAIITALRVELLRRCGCDDLARLYETNAEGWRLKVDSGRLEWTRRRGWDGAAPWPSDDDEFDDEPPDFSLDTRRYDVPRPWSLEAEADDAKIEPEGATEHEVPRSPRSVLAWALEERNWSPSTALSEFDQLLPEASAETTEWVRAAEALWRESQMTEDMLLYLVDRLLDNGLTDRLDADEEYERLFVGMRLIDVHCRNEAESGWDSEDAHRDYSLLVHCWTERRNEIARRYLASIGCQWLLAPMSVGSDPDDRVSDGEREWLDEDNAI